MLQTETPVVSARKKEIVQQYLSELDKHIQQIKNGQADKALEIKDFAGMLHVHPVHLSNTVKEVTGHSTCSLYETRLLNAAKELLLTTTMPIAQIARQLTYTLPILPNFLKPIPAPRLKNSGSSICNFKKS